MRKHASTGMSRRTLSIPRAARSDCDKQHESKGRLNLHVWLQRLPQHIGIVGAHSNRQIHKANPVFYFYLPPEGDLSPNEFSLVELHAKKNGREMTVGTSNAYTHSSGISEKEKVELTYEPVADGIYKVTPKQPLDEGEYCFVFTGSAPKLFSNNKVYDFGISPE